MSRGQYRKFLVWYIFALLPCLTFAFLALMILGFRTPDALLRSEGMPLSGNIVAMTIYIVASIWPLTASTVKRLHDLELEPWGVFFTFSPKKSWELGQAVLKKRGVEGPNRHGEDPGIHEP